MANLKLLEQIRQGTESWNRWRKANPDVELDFSGADLSHIDLGISALSRPNILGGVVRRAGINLSKANFFRATLQRANFTGANLSGANFRDSDLGGAYLVEANLEKADFTDANLHYAKLYDANLTEADFTGANLTVAWLHDSILERACFNRADAWYAHLSRANLHSADLAEADFRFATLESANLSWANLLKTVLEGADLSYADLSHANCSGANFSGADLRWVNTGGTNFAGAILRGTIGGMILPTKEILTPEFLMNTLGPFLKAVTDLQQVIDEIQGETQNKTKITEITQNSPINITFEGIAKAIQEIKDVVVPWRRRHQERLATLQEKEREVEIGCKRVEILERRARIAKDKADAAKVTAEADRVRAETERVRLENTKLNLEMAHEKLLLAHAMVGRWAPHLSPEDKLARVVELLPALDVLVSSDLEPIEPGSGSGQLKP